MVWKDLKFLLLNDFKFLQNYSFNCCTHFKFMQMFFFWKLKVWICSYLRRSIVTHNFNIFKYSYFGWATNKYQKQTKNWFSWLAVVLNWNSYPIAEHCITNREQIKRTLGRSTQSWTWHDALALHSKEFSKPKRIWRNQKHLCLYLNLFIGDVLRFLGFGKRF